jgi:hypothetical protein
MPLTDDDKRWIDERLERLETKLLTAFHKWSSPTDMRLRSHSGSIAALELEMRDLQDRVKKLEYPPTS